MREESSRKTLIINISMYVQRNNFLKNYSFTHFT